MLYRRRQRPDREHIVRSLFDNMRAIKRGMAGHFHSLNRDCPVSQAQLELLFSIREKQPVSFKVLAGQMYLTPGAVSQLAEDLGTHGYIDRQQDTRDRRVQYLHLTDAGGKLLESIEKSREQVMRDVVDGLTDEELLVWLRVQAKMLRSLQVHAHEQTETEN